MSGSSRKAPPPIVAKIFETASLHPQRDALICGDEPVNYRDLQAGIASAAGFLKSKGVRRGDRVILSAASRRPSFAYGYFACHAVGAIAVPVGPKIGEVALTMIARQTRPRLICLDAPPAHDLPNVVVDSFDSVAEAQNEMASVGLDDAADILYTSGSTGRPKGVVQTHRNILAFAESRNSIVGCTAKDRLVLPLPLSHGFGLGRLRCGMLCGGTVVLVDDFRFPGDIFRAFDEQKASAFCCVPSGFASLFRLSGDALGEYRDQLRFVETATAPLAADQRDRLLRLLPKTRIFNSYGMTETTSSIAFIDLHRAPRKLSSVGKPIPDVELKIVDKRRRRLGVGAVGQILIRGPNVMKGYWNDARGTRAVLAGGWCAANDVGFLDADGYLYLKGRKEPLINVGGLKVAPAEIENVLKKHPAVDECACIGIADPAGLTGEAVKAFLVPAPGLRVKPRTEELASWLSGKVESYKVPSQFVWIAELPKSALGKLQRGRLSGFAAEDQL